ncbi:cytochrome P450 [Frankia sp. CNm7]|uniref:Cytochrome P450 n=1 Tax=Frankia nepalensis TaxID=1836974 RepID=A0A937R9I6_9ACTN|nr:cytochrome P450 [Frankia nepalensis]MBL7509786.1 cytochrome P450 [Frankia nepalensis]MBL7522197.1 cytochrome P450 [Frankia nepalensis]MBL7627906.1 cytochrome P450 [Frankia nepalensis]
MVEFDAFDLEHRPDPYPRYRVLRETAPFCPVRLGAARVTVATTYEGCSAVLQGAEWGRGYTEGLNPFRPGVAPGEVPGGSFLGMDPPEHTRLRGLVSRAFTPRASLAEAPFVRLVVDRLLDQAVAAGGLDIVEDLARPLSLAVMCRLLGVPTADGPSLVSWIGGIARGTDPDYLLTPADIVVRTAAARDLGRYLFELAATRRALPRDDLLSRLVTSQRDQEVLTEREVIELCGLLLAAGLDTTANLIANGVLALLRHPDQLALLRERPEILPAAIEEMIRFDPPSQFVTRVALADTTVCGRPFRRGDGVVVLSASGHRDPTAFADPDRFDVTRYAASPPARRHLGFALGTHYCLGAPLARIQAEAAIGALARRGGDLSLVTEDIEYRPNAALRGPRALLVNTPGTAG